MDGKAKQCPLCGTVVAPHAGGDGGAAAMNRHFEQDCSWRHTSKAPMDPDQGRRKPPPAR